MAHIVLSKDWRLVPRPVRREMPHIPTEEMVRLHEWFLYRVTPIEGLTLVTPPSKDNPWWVFTGTHAECVAWLRRNAPDGILALAGMVRL